ncbi:MAG: hypothetical protein WBG50_17175 [Desulfomonilaceae bacterium]
MGRKDFWGWMMRKWIVCGMALSVMFYFSFGAMARKQVPQSPGEVVAAINAQFAHIVKQVLGRDCRRVTIAPLNIKDPEDWYVDITYSDFKSDGRLESLLKIISIPKFFMEDVPLIRIKTLEAHIMGKDSALRCSVTVSYPDDKNVLNDLLHLKDIARMPMQDRVKLADWVATWRFDKRDPAWTAADSIIAMTANDKSSPGAVADEKSNDAVDPEFEKVFVRILTKDCPACTSPEIYNKMNELGMARDYKAFESLASQGSIISLKKGTEVIRTGSVGDWGGIHVRPRGTLLDLWVNDACLERKPIPSQPR